MIERNVSVIFIKQRELFFKRTFKALNATFNESLDLAPEKLEGCGMA
jgi:hypothetical protein